MTRSRFNTSRPQGRNAGRPWLAAHCRATRRSLPPSRPSLPQCAAARRRRQRGRVSMRSWSLRRSNRKTCRTCPSASRCSTMQKLEQLHVVNLDDYVKYSPSIAYVARRRPGRQRPAGQLAHLHARRGQRRHKTTRVRSRASARYLDEQPVTTIDGTVDVHIYDIAAHRGARRAAGHSVRREFARRAPCASSPTSRTPRSSRRAMRSAAITCSTAASAIRSKASSICRFLRSGRAPGWLARARRRVHRQRRGHECRGRDSRRDQNFSFLVPRLPGNDAVDRQGVDQQRGLRQE